MAPQAISAVVTWPGSGDEGRSGPRLFLNNFPVADFICTLSFKVISALAPGSESEPYNPSFCTSHLSWDTLVSVLSGPCLVLPVRSPTTVSSLRLKPTAHPPVCLPHMEWPSLSQIKLLSNIKLDFLVRSASSVQSLQVSDLLSYSNQTAQRNGVFKNFVICQGNEYANTTMLDKIYFFLKQVKPVSPQ